MNAEDSYTEILSRTPTMPADEQQLVARRYAATKDSRDADRLVLGNLRLVVKMARELGGGTRTELMDLVQEGNAGLVEAVKRFDPGRGVKLTTYAAWWIRAYMIRHLMETSRIVRFASTREGRRRFFARTLPGPDVSLDAPISGADDGSRTNGPSAIEAMAADDGGRPDVQTEEREVLARFQNVVAEFRPSLDDRGRAIFDKRLLSESPAPLGVLARRFAVSGERVRQLEARVLGDLRDFVCDTLGEEMFAAA